MKKRLIALFLCSALIFGMIPTITRAADDGKVKITSNGQTVSKVYVPMNDPDGVTVTAVLPEGVHQGSGQWEIYISSMDKWVNIQGATGMSLNLRFALMCNAMDGSGVAKVRYTFTDVNSGKEMEPAYLTAILTQDSETTMLDEREHQEIKPIVTDPGRVDVHYLIEPEEKTEDKSEDKTEDKTEEKIEEKIEEKSEDETEDKTEDKPAEGQTSGETSNEGVTPDENTDGNQNAAENQNLDENPGQNEDPAQELDENLDTQNVDTDEENSTEESQETENVSLLSFLGLDSWALEVSADEVTPDVKKTYSIVVNYNFENGDLVQQPYTADLAEGSSWSATVTFPTVQGYLPYVNDVQQNSMELNYPSISENVTINVVYKPTNVNYTVIHYQQNVNDDHYTVESTETKQGLTGSQVPEVAKEFEGFYSLLYERPAIAADGSTVIEVYYDRYYYLMNFDMDGGYGTEPVYARYGASIGTVTNPTKAGYSFVGWSETKGGTTAVTLPTTMPADSKTYYAIWEPDSTAKVTVVFWGENADDEGYSYLADATKVINLKPGKEFTYSEGEMLVCDKEVHTHSEECGFECGKEEHTHGDSCRTLICTIQNHTHSASCYKDEEHSHGTSCYAGVGSTSETVSLGKPDNPKEGQVYQGRFGTYIYIGGTWYNYTGSTSSGSVAPTTCGKQLHTHTSACLTCDKQEAHYHTTSCYSGVGWSDTPSNAPSNPADGQIFVENNGFRNTSYIYISGSWYRYSGNANSGDIVKPTCGKSGPHTHTDSCYTTSCAIEEHTHDTKCYSCGKEEHNHDSNCYMQGAGLDGNLWKFVKSDTITVAADGSSVVNVYYDRTEKTLTFKYSYSRNSYQKTETITAKWGQNIATEYNAIVKNAGSTFWSANSNYSGPYTNYFGVMPTASKTYYYQSDNGSTGTMTYYGEDLNGNYVEMFSVSKVGGYTVTVEDHYEFKGFTYDHGTSNGSSCKGATFYYKRNSYTLTFNDQFSDVKKETVKYEAPLSTYKDYVPEVPSAYEPGSVEFGGWYLNPQCTGQEYKLNEHTMDASDLILYAKWVPVTHTVKFYLTEKSESIYKPEKADTEASFTISHADVIDEDYVKNHLEKSAVNEAKPNGDYTFVMWYYYENGDKKPFDPTTQIRKDLTLYGEWSSNTLKQYTVQYVLKSDHNVKVADDLTGSGLAGTTKTFDAKGGTELYADYQEGFFPTVQSQSLLLDIESNSLVITFEYVPMPAVPYTVKYVDATTKESLADDKVVSDNRKAVVTETFKPISGYMPDAYQKRLVLVAEENSDKNILYFYYTKDETHAYYKITHYTQNTDGATWTEYASSQVVGDIGTRYTGSPMTIPGFTYKEIKYVVDGKEVTDITDEGAKLTADGLEINLYYVRNEYPYIVCYLEQGSGNVLHDPKNGTGKYGQVISESAIDIDGYDKVDPTSVTLNIRIDEGEGAPNFNIITFYYKEQEVTINYVAVGPDGATNFGIVTPTTETVKVKSGTAQGSTPTAGDGFKFVGWFKDGQCTNPVDPTWVDANGKLVPPKQEGKNVATTYYAKFEYDVADLTITKTGADSADGDQTFIFTVTGTKGYSTKVVIKGNGSVTIKNLEIDTYTIHEENGWSWRYDCEDKTVTLQPGVTNSVTMTNTREKTKWLDGNAYVKNVFNQ